MLERQYKQKPTSCLQLKVCATCLSHSDSLTLSDSLETDMQSELPKLVVKIKTYNNKIITRKRQEPKEERNKKSKLIEMEGIISLAIDVLDFSEALDFSMC